jgi:predicted O-methyltransferase YrrM
MSNFSETLTPKTLEMLGQCFKQTDGMISFNEAILLYRLAKEIKLGCIVEIGSYRGRSSVFLARGSMDGFNIPVFAIEPHQHFTGVLGGAFGPHDRTLFYKTMLDNQCSEIVSLINLSSEQFASFWREPVSLLWIDGDHRYESVRRDVECWRPHLRENALVAFDDANDPDLGPHRMIAELTSSGYFDIITRTGKVAVIRRCK